MVETEAFNSSLAMVGIDGGRVRSLREGKGLTQLYVATAVGVTTDTISRWENRRYPSIKKENAQKLAEALEVNLEEILEQQPSPDAESPDLPVIQESSFSSAKPLFSRGSWLWWLLILGGIVATGLLWWFFRAHQLPVTVTASRILPAHSPVGQPFPVIIVVAAPQAETLSLLVKETLPAGCRLVSAVPPMTVIDEQGGILKWLSKGDSRQRVFAYMAVSDSNRGLGEVLRFRGDVTLRKGLSDETVIQGADSLVLRNFHWADTNADGLVDDEEILSVYDSVSVVEGLDFDRNLIDEIWSGKGYRWEEENRAFAIMP